MVSPSEFVNLEYSNDLTQAGIDYICQVLPYKHLSNFKHQVNEIREIICESAVDLAFRRYINQKQIPHEFLVEKPYTDPLRSEITIGGRRCKLICKTLTKKQQIRNIRKSPEVLMKEKATICEEEFNSDYYSKNDILVFCFLTALITSNQKSIRSVLTGNLPVFLIQLLPQKWSNPKKWTRFEELTIEGQIRQNQFLKLIGLDGQRNILFEDLTLSSNSKCSINKDFFSLSFIQTNILPESQFIIRNPTLCDNCYLQSKNWVNLWIYGLEIIIAGYATLGEFKAIAEESTIVARINNTRISQFDSSSIPIEQLHPLSELISRVKTWNI